MDQKYLILHNIRSAQNVGAIFRTADACGIDKIFLTGYAPAPVDRFDREEKSIAKAALGAEKNIAWEKIKTVGPLLIKLKKQGVQLIAIEQAKNSVDYKEVKPKFPVAFVFGNEVRGISPAILKKCDVVAEISMRGKKESLNVSVSAGVALFRILNI